MRYTRGLIILFVTVFCANAFAQEKQVDTASTTRVSANMVDYFNKSVGRQSRIYTGPIFQPYKFVSKTNANCKDSVNFNLGWVNYENAVYNNVLFIYDINRDILIAQLYNNFTKYVLISDKVSEFGLLGHHFIRLVPDEPNKQMYTGFYDELYRNKMQLLARRAKTIQEENVGNFMQNYFVNKPTEYYIKLHGKYYKIGSQSSILNVLKDKKQELTKYLKDNNISYKDDSEQAMVLLAAYYDRITN